MPQLTQRGWRPTRQRSACARCLEITSYAQTIQVAFLMLMRQLLKKQGYALGLLLIDRLPSCGAAKRRLGYSTRHEHNLRCAVRAENSYHMVPPANEG